MLDFSGAQLLSVRQTAQFLGENFLYRNQREISIRGTIYAFANSTGTQPVWKGIDGLVSGAHDYDQISLNGVNFGRGRLTNLNFSIGQDVRKKNYDATFTVWSSGNFENLVGDYYSGVSGVLSSQPSERIANFSENFSLTNDQNGIKDYDRSISFDILSGSQASSVAIAKALATGIFATYASFNLFTEAYPDLYSGSARKIYNETFDRRNNSFAFSEKFQFQGTGNYNLINRQRFDLGVDGFASVVEEGNIQGISSDYSGSAISAFNGVFNGAFARCNAAYGQYNTGTLTLDNKPVTRGIKLNKFDGSIGYNVVFSNDPRLTSGVRWEYTNEINRGPKGVITISENGTIKGYGQQGAAKFTSATGHFTNVVNTGIVTRVGAFYSGEIPVAERTALNRFQFGRIYNEGDGIMEYRDSYSDDDTLVMNNLFTKIQKRYVDDAPVHFTNRFNIVNSREIAQPSNQSTLGTVSSQIDMQGRDATELEDYITGASGLIKQPVRGSDSHLTSVRYSYSPQNNRFSLSAQYGYTEYKEFDDVLAEMRW